MTKKCFLIAVFLPLLASCGTVTTLANSDDEVARKLRIQRSNCDQLSRVYSGVSYDVCILNSTRGNTVFVPLALFYILDGVVSTAVDTVGLPYTIYQQSKRGDITLGVR